MFVVVSKRADFQRRCDELLSRWGKVRTAGSVTEAASLVEASRPSLIVVDGMLSDRITPELIQDWRGHLGDLRPMIVDTALTPLEELAALAAGAMACCDASLSTTELEHVIGVVLHGGVWVSKAAIPVLMSKLQTFPAPTPTAPPAVVDGLDELTDRQREVARLVGQGASNKQIARALDISDRTVKAHLTAIFEKLGVSDRLQLALHVNASREARP